MDPIVITGCSYNGMIMALSLASRGIESIILEPKDIDEKFFTDPRTTSITAISKNFFVQIGIWQYLNQFAAPIKTIYVVDNKNPDILEFDDENSLHLGYMIENYNLKKTLYQILINNKLIKVVKDQYVSATFDDISCQLLTCSNQQIPASLVIVCDGRNSSLRAQYFPYLVNKDYAQIAFVFNVSHEKEHENCAVEHFLPTGPFAILPLISQYHSAIVWSVKVDMAMVYKSLAIEDFQDMVQDLFGQFLGKISIITPISSFNLSAQMTRKYYHNNIVIVGDAAHSIHPLAGQGLNQGIKDVNILSGIIKKYYDLGLDINSCALDEYQSERRIANMKMFFATDMLDKVFSNNSSALAMIRKTGFKLLNKFPSLKKAIINYGIGH